MCKFCAFFKVSHKTISSQFRFSKALFFGLQNFDVTQFKKEGLKNKWQYCFAVTESGTQFQEELVQFVGWLIAF